MKGALETMMGVLMMALMAIIATAYITASLNTQSAQNYYASVVTEIEASDFSDAVISECKNNALDNGYEDLKVSKLSSNTGQVYAKVTLNYNYTVPLLNMILEHEITGYAR